MRKKIYGFTLEDICVMQVTLAFAEIKCAACASMCTVGMEDFVKERKQWDNQGMTLIELMVSFALLGIFFVAATTLISTVVRVHYDVRGQQYGLQVCTMIADKIAEELEGAQGAEGDAPAVALGRNGTVATLVDRSGSEVSIGTTEGEPKFFRLHYAEADNPPVSENSEKIDSYDSLDWLFDEKSYMGYAVKSLVFSLPGEDYESNVIRMDLEIESERYGVYQMTRYYQCYCLPRDTDEIKEIE